MKGEKFAVIGLGHFGSVIASKLASKGAEVMAIDNNENNVEDIQDEVAYAITLDATDKKALHSQNLGSYDAVVVAIGKNFEALLLCTVYLQELGVKRIISRANDKHQRKILEKLGVTEILSPENEVGRLVAERLINPNVISVLQLPDDYEIAEILAPKGIVNRTIKDIALRDRYKLNLITVKREFDASNKGGNDKDQHIIGVPTSETVIYESDTILLFGMAKDIKKFTEINQ